MTDDVTYAPPTAPGLKKIPPYWYPYTTMAKERWLGRELLEVVSTEFRDRSMEYYRYALESGVTTINGQIARPDTIIMNGDCIQNVVHRHEPPVTSTPVKVILHDVERDFIVVDKPGSIVGVLHVLSNLVIVDGSKISSPSTHQEDIFEIHYVGFWRTKWVIKKSTVSMKSLNRICMLTICQLEAVNRLDRLTSGLMIIPLTADRARQLTSEFMAGTVRKEYVARCKGEFPAEEVTCEEPLLTIDRQMGLNIVHPEGKPAKTIFNRIRYDSNTDTSVVRCQPLTGRSHQIRVHLQFLGHPIANDPAYSETKIWPVLIASCFQGENLGKGGIDIVPSDERAAPAPPPHLQSLTDSAGSPESLAKGMAEQKQNTSEAKLLPRETGMDIGMGSPVPLSSEAVGIITRLRNMKDEDEDWSRWRDVVFRAKGKLTPNLELKPGPHPNQRKRGGHARFVDEKLNQVMDPTVPTRELSLSASSSTVPSSAATPSDVSTPEPGISSEPIQLTESDVLEKVAVMEPQVESTAVVHSDNLYCPECYLPLHPDPKPERLYIFLHAKKYTTSLGSFETEMPEWTAEGWTWDQS
ncbi:hypothetical protein H0H92_003363 [Tricholoma furcatifolium]|nr:hypothetical protein H0H92_003363 [Tricholoma furcatifolium]